MSIYRVALVVVGVAAILWCFRPGMVFYARAMGIGDKEKPIPKWSGRLWFIVIGLWLVMAGLSKSEAITRAVSSALFLVIGVVLLLLACVGMWRDKIFDQRLERSPGAWRSRAIQIGTGAVFVAVGFSLLGHR
jgi:hypothetical protein